MSRSSPISEAVVTVRELADMRGVTERAIRKAIEEGRIAAHFDTQGSYRRYIIPLSSLRLEERKKVIRSQKIIRLDLLGNPAAPKLLDKSLKPCQLTLNRLFDKQFDEYSKHEREQIVFWQEVIADWEELRRQHKGRIEECTEMYCCQLKKQYPDLKVTPTVLYRKRQALNNGNLDGLINRHGAWIRGRHKVPQRIFDIFMGFALDDHKYQLANCIRYTRLQLLDEEPELVELMPSDRTFRRYFAEYDKNVVTLGRHGKKAYYDKNMPYIHRSKENLYSNQEWIEDGQRLDVLTVPDGGGAPHRLELIMYIDARSFCPVGWKISDRLDSIAVFNGLANAVDRTGTYPDAYF